jgi:hypothetical protein
VSGKARQIGLELADSQASTCAVSAAVPVAAAGVLLLRRRSGGAACGGTRAAVGGGAGRRQVAASVALSPWAPGRSGSSLRRLQRRSWRRRGLPMTSMVRPPGGALGGCEAVW